MEHAQVHKKPKVGYLVLKGLMLWQSRAHALFFEGRLVGDLKNKHPKFFLMSLQSTSYLHFLFLFFRFI